MRFIAKSEAGLGNYIQVPREVDSRLCAITPFDVQADGKKVHLEAGDTVELSKVEKVVSPGSFIVDNLPPPKKPTPR